MQNRMKMPTEETKENGSISFSSNFKKMLTDENRKKTSH